MKPDERGGWEAPINECNAGQGFQALSPRLPARLLSVNPDGGDLRIILEGFQDLPDGVAIDPIKGQLFYTFMGRSRVWRRLL